MSCPSSNNIKQPFPITTYECKNSTFFIDSIVSDFLMKCKYFQYLKTGINDSSKYRTKYQYTIPIYTFKYYDFNTGIFAKTYTYQELFDLNLLSMKYTINNINSNENIFNNLDQYDLEIFNNIHLLKLAEEIYNAVYQANISRSLGKDFYYTCNLPKKYFGTLQLENQVFTKRYERDELITLSRNAPILNTPIIDNL